MTRYLTPLLALALLFGARAQADAPATPFDEPVLSNVADATVITEGIRRAEESIFVVVPALHSQALADTLAAQAARVPVYLVIGDTQSEVPRQLSQAGVEVRTLGRMVEGLILIDYHALYIGGLITGLSSESQFIDLRAYGNQGVVQQLRSIWQAAEPYGGRER